MKYKKIVSNGYITMCGEIWSGTPISDSEYENIRDLFLNRPQAPQGYQYKLRADTLEWELVELPPIDDTDDDATESDYIDALNTLGVTAYEEN